MIALLDRVVFVVGPACHHFEYFMLIHFGLKVSVDKLPDSLMGLVGNCVSLTTFKILSIFILWHFKYGVSSVSLFVFILFETAFPGLLGCGCG